MITGGTSGIGFAIAHKFLVNGAERIILVGRSYERLVDAARRLGSSSITEGQADENIAPLENRISLLTGDVADTASSWLRELERELVCLGGSSTYLTGGKSIDT